MARAREKAQKEMQAAKTKAKEKSAKSLLKTKERLKKKTAKLKLVAKEKAEKKLHILTPLKGGPIQQAAQAKLDVYKTKLAASKVIVTRLTVLRFPTCGHRACVVDCSTISKG